MATIGISEFTYGYAFLYEQTRANWGNLRAAPILPSLREEQQQAWDAHLPVNGTDYYYQFKLTDYLSRSNATFIRDGPYNAPYYRLAFHRRYGNRQHQRLRQHAQTNPHTYYVAPEFNSIEQFNAAFLAQQTTARSRIIALRDCDDVFDADQHYITFQTGSPDWIQHSPEKRHHTSYTGEQLPVLYRESRREWKRVDKNFASDLFNKTAALVTEIIHKEEPIAREMVGLLEFEPEAAEMQDVLLRTADLLSVTLGVSLVLVGTQ